MIPINGIPARLVDDAELKFLPNGRAVANFRVATDDGYRDRTTGDWVKKESSFWGCSAYGEMGENIVDHLKKGQLVLITGKARIRQYEVEGVKKLAPEIEVSDIGPSLKWKPKENEETVPF
jgi:single-strand DNA-binding protein